MKKTIIRNQTQYHNEQYDEMKSLLNKSKRLFEQVEDIEMQNEEKNTYQETMDDFIEQVSDLVDYNSLNIYENNVEWTGNLVKLDTEFFYSVGERNGVYITGSMVKLDEEALEILSNLKNYYQMFSTKWAKVLADRKSTNKREEENE